MITEGMIASLRHTHRTSVPAHPEEGCTTCELYTTVERLWKVVRAAEIFRNQDRPYRTVDARAFDAAIADLKSPDGTPT